MAFTQVVVLVALLTPNNMARPAQRVSSFWSIKQWLIKQQFSLFYVVPMDARHWMGRIILLIQSLTGLCVMLIMTVIQSFNFWM
ncbi:Hypothetical protein GbCGDNIH9_8725 [Granulibacter bethesdensis]|uniref:Uncharacterized protein n=1 Tax=Granulibacter bethesdensis TaxID=364410 RepID=A0AAC9KCL2_9PROT|nr:Hypothetical protein GbCGDNIH9_8725 [Granulibacter bethesdensis]APH62424.1 Hypothetical protein GbCGDNIH8_8725 [Granulibacter bethesdensis]